MASDLLIGYYAELDGDGSITLDREELSTGSGWIGKISRLRTRISA